MIRSHTSAPSGSRPSASACGAHVEDALVVARQHQGEPADRALVPVVEEPGRDRRVGPLAVRARAGRARRVSSSGRSGTRSTSSGLTRLAVEVEHVGDAAGHPGREVAPGRAEDERGATGHVLAAVVAHALDDGGGPGVAHAEALADPAAQEELAGGRAVADDVAGDDVLLGRRAREPAAGPHDDAAAGQALADVVVGVALRAAA